MAVNDVTYLVLDTIESDGLLGQATRIGASLAAGIEVALEILDLQVVRKEARR